MFDATESDKAVEDALDENANCGGNLWFETTFSTTNPAVCLP